MRGPMRQRESDMARDESTGPREATTVNRRSALRALGGVGAAAASGPLTLGEAAAAPSDARRSKARFKPDAAQVQTFYRVNKY